MVTKACGGLAPAYSSFMDHVLSNPPPLPLDVRSNALGDLGMGHIIRGLSTPQRSRLEQLDVQSNNITEDSLSFLRGACDKERGREIRPAVTPTPVALSQNSPPPQTPHKTASSGMIPFTTSTCSATRWRRWMTCAA